MVDPIAERAERLVRLSADASGRPILTCFGRLMVSGGDWARAEVAAATLREQIQGVFEAVVREERERALAALVGVLQRDAHGEILDYEDAQAAIRGEAEKEESDGA